MALTAIQLFNASQISPSMFGPRIVNPELDETQQEAVAVAYIESDVLPGACAEVSVPLRLKTGHSDVRTFLEARYPQMLTAQREALIVEGEALFDAAVKSYGRSELNKSVDSNAQNYDKDSDQDRIQGNQRLAKLLEWASSVAPAESSSATEQVHSEMVFVSPVWGQGKNLDYYEDGW